MKVISCKKESKNNTDVLSEEKMAKIKENAVPLTWTIQIVDEGISQGLSNGIEVGVFT